jgi:hypothetical protein
MKLKTVFLAGCLLSASAMQAQNYEWAATLGGSLADRGQSIITDANGNVYTTGFFEGTADFDPDPSVSRNLSSNGNRDVFIQKLDANGSLVWAGNFGGTSNDEGEAIDIDASGNIYIAGYFAGTADFDPGPMTVNLTSNGNTDAFVVKLDSNGVLQWARTFGGPNGDEARYIDVDAAGNVYTTGFFFNSGDFDPGSGTVNLTANGKGAFVQKLDSNGNLVWAKSFDGTNGIEARCISVDASGNVYTTGDFRGTVDFDPDTSTFSLSATANIDAFVQKLDTDGNLLWAKNFGGLSNEYAYSIDVDGDGNIYTCGSFMSTVDFDPGLDTFNLTALGGLNMYVSKFSASGDFRWAGAFLGPSTSEAYSLHVEPNGNVYTTGTFSGTVDFDPGTGVANLSPAPGTSAYVFVQKMDSAGVYQWATAFGGAGVDAGINIYVDPNENIYTTGYFSGTVDFDPDTTSTTFTSSGSTDVFSQKLSFCQPTYGTDVQTACGSFTWIDGNTYTASNNTATYVVPNAQGCDSVITLNLTINNVSDVTTFLSGSNTITANNTSATYRWLDCDNNFAPIPGETAQSFTPATDGNYAVELTENGCVDTSACVNVTTVGIREQLSETIKLFPNPSTGTFSVDLGETEAVATITITDMTGKVVNEMRNPSTGIIAFDLNLKPGLYLLKVLSDKDKTAIPLIIK